MSKTNKRMRFINQRIKNGKRRLFARDSLVRNANTPFDVLYDDGLASLRHFAHPNTEKQKYSVPLLIIPPLAVNSKIFDFLEHRSFIQFMLNRGFSIYMIDWGEPHRQDRQRGFDYYVTETIPRMVRAVREYSGSDAISLYGWSLGGLFTILHTAYSRDPHIKNLFLVGVPIDAYASGFLGKFIELAGSISHFVEKKTGLHLRQLPTQMTHVPGWANMLMFKAIDPVGTTKSYWHLFKNLGSKDALYENATKVDFLNNMLDYPGAVIKNTALDFLLSNSVIRGKFVLDGQTIDLANITANLFVIAGKTDTLATTDSVKALMTYVSSTDKTFIEIPGGHVGIVASDITSERTWPVMADWLAERS